MILPALMEGSSRVQRSALSNIPSEIDETKIDSPRISSVIIRRIMLTRSNETWLSDLRSEGPARELALTHLREIVQNGLPYAPSRWLSPDNALFNPPVVGCHPETSS